MILTMLYESQFIASCLMILISILTIYTQVCLIKIIKEVLKDDL